MPNMYRGPATEAYQAKNILPNGQGALLPPDGTIARGYVPYGYTNSTQGYDSARLYLNPPFVAVASALLSADQTAKIENEGKELYGIFCTHCHGEKGDGQGILVQREKILGVPSYSSERLPDISAGSIYHVITYGKGIMGSHASQISSEERWKIVFHVLKLREELSPKQEPEQAS